jgi:hypothetical protein
MHTFRAPINAIVIGHSGNITIFVFINLNKYKKIENNGKQWENNRGKTIGHPQIKLLAMAVTTFPVIN